jgi:hypothetical protein
MSTIKSSDEHLTLNADGSGKDIKFQSNGSEVASISDGGVVTATSYAGSGANLTGILSSPFIEVNTNKFTYTTDTNPVLQVIDSTNTVKAQMQSGNASAVFGSASNHPVDFIQGAGEATRMRIDTNGNVGIGVTPESTQSQYYKTLDVASGASFYGHTTVTNRAYFGANQYLHSSGVQKYKATSTASLHEMDSGTHKFKVAASGSADADITWTNALEITNDGRGLSQFTAKAWVNWNGTGTVSIYDSHNVSSIVDVAVGRHKITIGVDMANDDYAIVGSVSNSSRGNLAFGALAVGLVETYARESHTGDYTDYGSHSTVIFGD